MVESIDSILVTVITVTYNSSSFVEMAMQSVLHQTHLNIQYIVGDDCSSDDTWEKISQINDPRIIAYRNLENIGEYRNRNKALEKAEGEFVIFIDGDDFLYPHALRYFIECMNAHKDCAFLVQKNYFNNIIFPLVLYPEESLDMNYFSSCNLLSSSFTSNFFRTSILKESGYLSISYKSGDEEIRLRLAAAHPVLFVQGWVSWPRETYGQASSRISENDRFVEKLRMFDYLLKTNKIQCQTFIEDVKCLFVVQSYRLRIKNALSFNFDGYKRITYSMKSMAIKNGIWYSIGRIKSRKDLFSSSSPMNPFQYKLNHES